ncbi:MAG TPA: O-antigen ligase family protein [Actinomycetota bacterium]|nr:O-antigen ligase family protein [Actinomycetota bacterium]
MGDGRGLDQTSSSLLIRASVIVVIVGVPLVCVPYLLSDNFPTPKLALLLSAAAGGVALELRRRLLGVRSPIPRGFLFVVAAMAAPLFLSWLASPYKAWALWGEYQRYQGLLPMMGIAAFALVASVHLQGRVVLVAWGMSVTAALIALYAILQWRGLDPVQWPARVDYAFSTVGNSNFTSGYLAMSLCLTPALWSSARRRLSVVIIGIVIVLGLIATHSAAAFGAAVGGGAVALGLGPCRRWAVGRLAAAVVPLFLAFALSAVVPLSEIAPLVADKVGVQATERAHFWQAAAGMASQYPVIGRGPDAYAVEGISHRPYANAVLKGYQFASEPHSVPLSVLTSAGLIGLAGFVALVLWLTRRMIVIARSAEPDPLGAALGGAAIAYLLQSFVSIDDISVRVAFWGVLAALAAHATRRDRAVSITTTVPTPTPTPSLGRRVIAGALVIAVVSSAIWASVSLLIADNAALRGTQEYNAGDADRAFASFDRALGFRDHYVYRELYGERLGSLARIVGEDGKVYLDRMRDQFEYLEEVPDDVGLVKFATALYRWSPNDDSVLAEARDVYDRALEVDPKNPAIAIGASDVLLASDMPDEAVTLLERYEFVPTFYPAFWGAVALAYVEAGEFELAEPMIERALDNNSDDQRALEAQSQLRERARV